MVSKRGLEQRVVAQGLYRVVVLMNLPVFAQVAAECLDFFSF